MTRKYTYFINNNIYSIIIIINNINKEFLIISVKLNAKRK